MSILQEILAATRDEVSRRRGTTPIGDLQSMARDAARPRSFRGALSAGFSLIAEVKVRSPSAGPMATENVERAHKVYENTPEVAAVSVVTQERHFGGSLQRLAKVRQSVTKPLLRKDFIFDEYQVWEARAFGADAILLMATLFTDPGGRQRLADLYGLCRQLGMDALFEIGMSDRDPEELASFLPPDAEIWGVNSRTFHARRFALRRLASRLLGRDLTTHAARHRTLRRLVPPGKLAVAESGLDAAAALREVHRQGYAAALVGTAFLKTGRVVEEAVSSFAGEVARLRQSGG